MQFLKQITKYQWRKKTKFGEQKQKCLNLVEKCFFVAIRSQVLIETFRKLLSDLILTQKTST